MRLIRLTSFEHLKKIKHYLKIFETATRKKNIKIYADTDLESKRRRREEEKQKHEKTHTQKLKVLFILVVERN